MQEKNMVMGSLLCCLAGTLIIIFMADNSSTPAYQVSEINSSLEGSEILVSGYLQEITHSDKLTRFKVRDMTGSLTSVVFENDIELKENAFVQIKGEVTVFNNRTELSAKEIYSS